MNWEVAAIVLGWVKQKAPGAHRAQDLYTSPLWRRRRAFATASGLPWFVFSAKHALLRPDEIVNSYDVAMASLRGRDRLALGEVAADALERELAGLAGRTIEVHAGRYYVDMIRPGIEARGGSVLTPLAGMSIGRQLNWHDGRR